MSLHLHVHLLLLLHLLLHLHLQVGRSDQHQCSVKLVARSKTWEGARRRRRRERRGEGEKGVEEKEGAESVLLCEQEEAGGGEVHNSGGETSGRITWLLQALWGRRGWSGVHWWSGGRGGRR